MDTQMLGPKRKLKKVDKKMKKSVDILFRIWYYNKALRGTDKIKSSELVGGEGLQDFEGLECAACTL